MALIEILLNGESKKLPAGITVAELIKDLGLLPERLAVEYNLHILKRKHWEETALAQGDRIEMVHFVGGGACRSSIELSRGTLPQWLGQTGGVGF